MQEEKGCVYFFRHIGLSPIKIGYSENESPIKRFEQFKTYAPFGAELIGFIRTLNAKKLESELHNKYSRDRVKGEWFEITKEEIEKCISFYSNIEDIEEMNNFQISWAKKINFKKENIGEDFFNIFSLENKLGFQKKIIVNQGEISNILKKDKSDVRIFLIENEFKLKTFNINGVYKKGYKLWTKDF